MLKITIDIGNTLAKTAAFSGDLLIKEERISDISQAFLTEFVKELPDFELQKTKAILSTVRCLNQETLQLLHSFFDLIVLDFATPIPIKNHYKTPQTLGSDRLASVIGAAKIYPNENILVFDLGSCITWDFLDATKNYHGGGIAPGIKMRLQAVHNFTAKLPLIETDFVSNLCGKTTAESIKAGCVNATALEIDAIIDDFKKHFSSLRIVLCGGDAKMLQKEIKNDTFARLDLVQVGLKEILDFNEYR